MDDDAALGTAAQLIDLGQDANALRYIGPVLAHDPDNPLARLYEVMALEGVDADRARLRGQALVADHPDWAEAWVQLTFVLAHHATPAEAATAAGRTLQLDPDNIQVHLSMSDCLFNAEQYQASLEAVDRALRLGTQLWQAQVRRGYCLFMLGRRVEGLQIVRRVVGEHPDEPEAVKALAALEADSGNHQRALDLANRAANEAMGQKGTAEVAHRILLGSLNLVILTWLGAGLGLSIIWGQILRSGPSWAPIGVVLPVILVAVQVLAWPRLSRGQTRRKVVSILRGDSGVLLVMGWGLLFYCQTIYSTVRWLFDHQYHNPLPMLVLVAMVGLIVFGLVGRLKNAVTKRAR